MPQLRRSVPGALCRHAEHAGAPAGIARVECGGGAGAARFRRARPLEVTSRAREAILRLAHDVPARWSAAATPPQDRQESVRGWVDRVTVDVHEDRAQGNVTIHGGGGVTRAP